MTMLTATKLHPPRLRGAHLLRPRLLAQLDAAVDADVILICAPPGYGKTTLAVDWLTRREVGCVAWISLDQRDNELDAYLRYVIAAVRLACGNRELCANTDSLLEAGHTPAISVFIEAFLADLSALDAPVILALDDYHLITDPAVRQVMGALLQRTPPLMRLLLISRTEPELPLLARLRAQARVVEIRANDLRFVQAEARAILERAAGTTVSEEAAELLETQTEGWIVGLQLAGLSLRGQEDQLRLASRFADQGNRMVTEYLLDEVLARQPEELQRFLLRTSILDRFTAELCAALAGEAAQEAAQEAGGARAARRHLDNLAQANLFLTSLDAQGEWYRYHNLFQALLVRRLEDEYGKDEIGRLQRRAGSWFAQHGFIEEAMQHLIAGGDANAAAALVEKKRHEVLDSQQIHLLERWLGLLPEAVVNARPALLQLRAWILRVHFQLPAMVPLLNAAEALGVSETRVGDDAETETLRGERDTLRSEIAFWQNDFDKSLSLAQSALTSLPTDFYFARGLAAFYQLVALHASGETGRALKLLSGMLDDGRLQHPAFKGRLLVAAGGIYGAIGDLWRLKQTGDYLLSISQVEKQALNVGWAHFFLGHVFYQHDRLEEASAHWGAVQALRYHAHFRTYLDATLGLALIRQLQGDLQGAQETLAALAQAMLEMKQNQLAPEMDAFRARLALLRGDVAFAVRWVETGARAVHTPFWFWETSDLTRIKVLLARGSGADLEAAEALLEASEQYAERTRYTWLLIQVWALRAVLAAKQDRPDGALDPARHALHLAEPAGYIRLLADTGGELKAVFEQLGRNGKPSSYLQRLLEAFTPQSTPGAETLTDREAQVLALLRKELSDQEIAQRLTLSILTVKTHNRNIYRKLGVSDRQQAVAKATALGLLP